MMTMLSRRAKCFLALASPVRLKILELLQESDLCACDIQLAVNLSRSQLHTQLQILEAAQLIAGHQDGDWYYYSIQADPLRQLKEYLDYLGEPLLLPAQHCGSPPEDTFVRPAYDRK